MGGPSFWVGVSVQMSGAALAGESGEDALKVSVMARRAGKKSPKRGSVLPGQLGLFDGIEAPQKARAPAAAKPMKRARRAVAPPVAASRSERPVALNPREAAQYLGVSVSTLKLWRAQKIGPKWTKRGARLTAPENPQRRGDSVFIQYANYGVGPLRDISG